MQSTIEKCKLLLASEEILAAREKSLLRDLKSLGDSMNIKDISLDHFNNSLRYYLSVKQNYEMGTFLNSGKCDYAGLVESWKLSSLVIELRERSLYMTAKKFRSFEEFSEDFTTAARTEYLQCSWSAMALYMAGDGGVAIEKILPFYQIGALRNDVVDFNDCEPYLFQTDFLEYLVSSSDSLTSKLDQLSAFDSLSFMKESFYDDKRFQISLEKLLGWHLNECRYSIEHSSYYPVEPYGIFPIWVLALDKRRQAEGFISVLAKNDILERCLLLSQMTEGVLQKSNELPEVGLYRKVRFFIDSRYNPIDTAEIVEFWMSFLR